MNKDQSKLVPVILCGGMGTRLWPLSRKHVPKQFIPIQDKSLFGLTLERLSGLEICDIVVVSAAAHRFFVAEEMTRSKLSCRSSILLEPIARDTAPAVALAALHVIRTMDDRPLLVLPSDHMINNVSAFEQAVSLAMSQVSDGIIVTFGIFPDSGKTGYGYVQKGASIGDGFFKVAQFREKPDAATANAWVASGNYYWNSGIFLFHAQTYLNLLTELAPDILAACSVAYENHSIDLDFLEMQEEYFAQSPKISIDYAVIEKANNVIFLPTDIGWNDVGSWQSLGNLLPSDSNGNAVYGDVFLRDAGDNIVYANRRLVGVLGIEGCIVAETNDVVLVAKHDQSENIKQLVADLQTQEREEIDFNTKMLRPWGSYEKIDCGIGFQVKKIIVNPKQALSLQMHRHRSEHWVVVKGKARVTCGDDVFDLEENQSTYIPKLLKHRLENCSDEPLFLIEVQCGDYLGEDDIVRFEDIYGRAKNSTSG